ncbi:type VII secretion protein EccB [Mycolicibacterium austroafricanum]|uniref:Type VII secretion protein EccB n=1 Tax=Mycolicibacterium austroafricanum TaxID=39687 RepID=A0ABT8H8A2_MYCAO|nr:type VII secretion protein EccB [Mycolicibacterium austroafricanum]MDN4516990.1 type VII secretion protein EccB [Mycolicibacterium austroafricanum]QRZ09778.1 type VII secretion protein EccB [Mycolicibacterium austroafricanum]QZT71227.1 type VII secretion protein EccB [Mycolicibacterium austroafricanum]
MRQPTTRLQVSGHRFLMRRMEHALVRGDPRMLDDPLRGQSLSMTAGAVLAVIAVAVCGVLAFIRPGGELGEAPLVVVRESGAMYVRIDGTMHPVFNLASARLILGAAAQPRVVTQRAVDRAELGPQVGIPDAPAQISPPLQAAESGWTVCDESSGTTVISGPVTGSAMTPDASVLVTPRGGSAALTYLLHGRWRARVDLRHPAVVRALRLDGVVPQQVSPALLDAVPEAPAISAPHIPARGSHGPSMLRQYPVGTVVRASGTRATADYFVVLADGLQRVGEVAADLIRYTDSRPGAEIPAVSAAAVGAMPVVTTLPVTTFPDRGGVASAPVVCAHWTQQPGETTSHTSVLVGESVHRPGRSVTLVQADGDGPAVDTVAVPAGRSVFVRSVSLTGAGQSTGALFLVTDAGVRFGVRDHQSAEALGLTVPALPAPWPVLATLPRGPELGRDDASVLRDGAGTR